MDTKIIAEPEDIPSVVGKRKRAEGQKFVKCNRILRPLSKRQRTFYQFHLVIEELNNRLTVINEEWKPCRYFKGHSSGVRNVIQLQDGRLVSCANDDRVCFWDLEKKSNCPAFESRRQSHQSEMHVNWCTNITQLSDGRLVVSARSRSENRHSIRIHDNDFKTFIELINENYTQSGPYAHSRPTCSVQLSDGRLIVGSTMGIINIWNIETKTYTELKGHSGFIFSIIQLPDGYSKSRGDEKSSTRFTRIASCSRDGTIRIWNLETEKSTILKGHTSAVWAVCYLHDGRLASCAGTVIRIWDISNMRKKSYIELLGHTDTIYCLDKLPDGRLVSSSRDRTVRVWTIETGTSEIIAHGIGVWVCYTKDDREQFSKNLYPFLSEHLIDNLVPIVSNYCL